MDNFFYLIKPAFFWLFILSAAATALVCAARLFIKDPAVEKKRNYLYYCSLEANAVLLLILGIYGVNMPDHAVWELVLEISAGMVVILGLFVKNFHQELWLQQVPKSVKGMKLAKAKR